MESNNAASFGRNVIDETASRGDAKVHSMSPPPVEPISVIVPTVGRPESLLRMLTSLSGQTVRVAEVIVADGSATDGTKAVISNQRWIKAGLSVRRVSVFPPNAVRQRKAAIHESKSELLLLLDDDVELEPDCIQQMLILLRSQSDIVAVGADFNNQSWSQPTRIWRLYLNWACGSRNGEWQGKVLGPLLRFGFNPTPSVPMEMEWLGAGMSLIKRTAYDRAGGFSDLFLHRCTMNEDVDLGLKLRNVGRILFCPSARMGHFHDSSGRVSPRVAAEDDLYNRYLVMHRTQKRSPASAFALILVFFSLETASSFAGCLRRLRSNGFGSRLTGRLSALFRIIFGTLTSKESN